MLKAIESQTFFEINKNNDIQNTKVYQNQADEKDHAEFLAIFSESLRFRPLADVAFEGWHGGQYHFPFGFVEMPTQLKHKLKGKFNKPKYFGSSVF